MSPARSTTQNQLATMMASADLPDPVPAMTIWFGAGGSLRSGTPLIVPEMPAHPPLTSGRVSRKPIVAGECGGLRRRGPAAFGGRSRRAIPRRIGRGRCPSLHRGTAHSRAVRDLRTDRGGTLDAIKRVPIERYRPPGSGDARQYGIDKVDACFSRRNGRGNSNKAGLANACTGTLGGDGVCDITATGPWFSNASNCAGPFNCRLGSGRKMG